MLRRTVSPGLEPAIDDVFARAARSKSILSIVRTSTSAAPLGPSIEDLLEEHDPRAVSALSDAIRRVVDLKLSVNFGSRLYHQSYRDTASARHLLAAVRSVSPSAALVLTTHPSGFVREAAVRAIAIINGPFGLALLVHRLNDWVIEVRHAAEAKLSELRDRLHPNVVAASIEEIWAFERYGRATPNAHGLVAALRDDPGVMAALRAVLDASSDSRAARLAGRMLRTDFLDDQLPDLARHHRHGGVRALASRAMLAGAYRWTDGKALRERPVSFDGSKRELALQALQDQSPKVQAAGLEWVVANRLSIGDASALMLPFSVHPAASVSGLAQFGLAELGVDWLAFARAQLIGPSGPRRNVALALAEHGNADDAERIYVATDGISEATALPLWAVSACLKHDVAVQRLTAVALTGDDISLARRAARLLKRAGVRLTSEQLAPLADRGDDFLARGLRQFVAGLDVMEQLEIIGRLERAGASFELDAWFQLPRRKINRGAFAPSRSQMERLSLVLADCPMLQARVRQFLAF